MMIPSTSFASCNVYITSASSQSAVLLSLLKVAQSHCQRLRDGANPDRGGQKNNGCVEHLDLKNTCNSRLKSAVAVILAYADRSYNRSSFHLAGRSDYVSDVAIGLILNAYSKIRFDDTSNRKAAHPSVGMIDHISVMPLSCISHMNTSSLPTDDDEGNGMQPSQTAAVQAALRIDDAIKKSNTLTEIYYYGSACPNETPLATVRREKTSFFRSGESNGMFGNRRDSCTIGVPHKFVENFNIRLTKSVSYEQAKTLTRHVRGRNRAHEGYGVDGVEALTLPYYLLTEENIDGDKKLGDETLVYEVACNLTNPRVGSSQELRKAVGDWVDVQLRKQDSYSDDGSYRFIDFIDRMYQVGTTEEQCQSVLLGCEETPDNNFQGCNYWETHDKDVFLNFQQFLK